MDAQTQIVRKRHLLIRAAAILLAGVAATSIAAVESNTAVTLAVIIVATAAEAIFAILPLARVSRRGSADETEKQPDG